MNKRRVTFLFEGGIRVQVITDKSVDDIDKICSPKSYYRAAFGNVRILNDKILYYKVEEDNGDRGFGTEKSPWEYGEDEIS